MLDINSEFHGSWKNPKTNNEVLFAIDKDGRRYTSCPYFGFILNPPHLNLLELVHSLSSTRCFANFAMYLVEDVLSLAYNLEVSDYKEVVMRPFALSGVGVIPLIDEVCGYKNKMIQGEYSKIFNQSLRDAFKRLENLKLLGE